MDLDAVTEEFEIPHLRIQSIGLSESVEGAPVAIVWGGASLSKELWEKSHDSFTSFLGLNFCRVMRLRAGVIALKK